MRSVSLWSAVLVFCVIWDLSHAQGVSVPGEELGSLESLSVGNSAEVDLAIVFHASSKTRARDFKKLMLTFLSDVLAKADISSGKVKVAVINYGTDAKIIFDFNKFSRKPDVRNAIRKLPKNLRSKKANAGAAMQLLQQLFTQAHGDRPGVPNGVIWLTDSPSDVTSVNVIDEARRIKESGVKLFTVGVAKADRSELQSISSVPWSNHSIHIARHQDLGRPDVKEMITQGILALQGRVPVPPTPPPRPTTTEERVTPDRALSGPVIPLAAAERADIIIAVHVSRDTSLPNFQLLIDYLKALVSRADVDSGRVQIGLIFYGQDASSIFYLNSYSRQSEIIRALEGVSATQRTYYADASRAIVKALDLFSTRYGHRQGVSKGLVVITDGASTQNQDLIAANKEIAMAEGVEIFSVGVGMRDKAELENLATSSGNIYTVQTHRELSHTIDSLRRNILALRTVDDFQVITVRPDWPIPITLPSARGCGQAKVDLVIILDSSTSVTEENFKKMLGFCKDFLQDSDIDNGNVQVGIVSYSTEVHVDFQMNRFRTKRDVMTAIDNIPYRYGSTNTADGLKIMRTEMFTVGNGDRRGVPDIAIVLTDGISNINAQRTIPEAEAARNDGIHIYAIGIGLQDTRELDAIASQPASENSFNVQDFDQLRGLEHKVFEAICPVPIPITFPPPASGCGDAEVDLVIILDSSTSVTEGNFKKMLTFCEDLLSNANIDGGSVRVGIVLYSSSVQVEFQLNTYSNAADMFEKIRNIPYIYGSTNTADGLKTMHDEMFTARNGDRPGVPNLAILITDGISNINARRTIPEAELARDDNIHLYVVGIGLTDRRELDQLSTRPMEDNTFAVNDFDELKGLDDQLFSSICPVEKLCESPGSPANGRRLSDDFRVRSTVRFECDRGYWLRGRELLTCQEDLLWDSPLPTCEVKLCESPGAPRHGRRLSDNFLIGSRVQFACDRGYRLEGLEFVTCLDSLAWSGPLPRCEGLIAITLPPVSECGEAKVDLVIILDSSTSVTESNFKKMLTFVEDFLSNADIDGGSVRVGIVLYSSSVQVEFQLNTYTNSADMFEKIRNIPYIYGSTNTADGLKTMHDEMFKEWNGDRPDVPNMAILITDGISNINARRTIPEAELARDDNIHLYVVGIGLTDRRELDQLSTRPMEENTFAVDDFDELKGLDEQLFSSICPGAKVPVKECESPGIPLNGRRLDDDFLVGSSVRFECDARYWLRGRAVLTCQESLVWDFPLPTCSVKSCESPGEPEYGLRLSNDFTVGSTVGFVCDEGYRLFGLESLLCQETLVWSGPVPICEVKPIPITFPPPLSECGAALVDLVIVLDSSTSVTEVNFKKMLIFIKDLLGNADIDSGNVRVGIVEYSTDVEVQFHLNRYSTRAEIFDAVDNIPYVYGSTNTAGGLEVMRNEMFTFRTGDRSDAQNIGIVITDGVSNINARRTIPAAEEAREDGIHIYALGIGLTDTRELDAIASVPHADNSFNVQDFDQLKGLEQKIFSAICPVTPPIRITLAPPIDDCGLSRVDLVIILDSSTSVTEGNFKKMLTFCNDLLRNADIDSGNVRVGVVLYSTDVTAEFYLSQYVTSTDIMEAIDNIQYVYGSTNTAGGLQMMREEMFTYRNGDRPDVPNVAIIITDGISNINARQTIPQAEAARAENIHIYAIGIGLTDTTEVDAIASVPASENSFTVTEFEELKGLDQTIFQSICPGKSCESPGSPRYGRRLSDVFIVGSTVGFACDVGYEIVGRQSVTCQEDLTWDYQLPTCQVLLCPNPGSPANGRRLSNDFNVGSRVRFECDAGYILLGAGNLLCQPDQTWDRRVPFCQARECTDPGLIANGRRLTDVFTVGSRVRFVCNEGFLLVGRDTLRCQLDSSWDASPPVCQAQECQSPGAPTNGRILSDVFSIGSRVRFTCDEGYVMVGIAYIECQRDLTWNWDVPVCQRRECEDPGRPRNGLRVHDDFSVGSRVRFVCNEGYLLVGAEYLTCQRDATWNEPIPSCRAPVCTDPGQPAHGRRLTDDYSIGSRVRFVCDEGYALIGNEYLTCQPSATWDISLPICRARQCPDPGSPAHGRRLSDSFSIGSSVGYVCDQGYELVGSKSLTCQRDGRWNRPLPVCKERACPNPGSPAHGRRLSNKYTIGSRVRFVCDETYSLVGSEYLTCQRDASWDRPLPSCQAKPARACPNPGSPAHGRRLTNIFTIGSRVRFVCDETYSIVGSDYLTCQRDASWDVPIPTCQAIPPEPERQCENPGSPAHGRRLSDKFTIGSRVRFQCDRGYSLVGSEYLRCKRDVTWDRPLPVCQERQCPSLGSPRHGRRLSDDVAIGSKVRFVCDETYRLIGQDFLTCKGDATWDYSVPACRGASTKCTSTGDIVFILDSSGSVGEASFRQALNFTYQTVEGLDIDSGNYQVGVISFSNSARMEFPMNRYSTKVDVENALRTVDYVYGYTHTASALRMARLEFFTPPGGDRADVPNIVIIITDGQSNINHYETIPEAKTLKRLGTTIITIAVGFTGETDELVGLTSAPVQENLIYAENYDALEKLTEQLVTPLCTDSDMCLTNPCKNGGVCVDGLRSYMCRCSSDYFGINCEKRCGEAADVVIVLDSSSTVGAESFERMKLYAEHLVREMNVDACDIRIGAIKYSSRAMIQFHLGEHADEETNIRAIDDIHYTRGRANMADAFSVLRTRMFNNGAGDRREARNIVYFFTDGTVDVNAEGTLSEAELTIQSGIRVIPIGVGLRMREEVENIASSQGVTTIEIDSESTMMTMSDQMLQPIYDREDYCTPNPCKYGGTCNTVAMGFTCDCVPGYSGDNCERRCEASGDVVFAVDTSRYVSRKELRRIKRFVRSLIKRMEFKNERFRVGLVQFSDTARVLVKFQGRQNKRQVLSQVSSLRAQAGDPVPAAALAKANLRILRDAGKREGRPKYVVFITRSMRETSDIYKEANKLKAMGSRVIGVGIGMSASAQEAMGAVVSSPLKNYYHHTDDFKGLNEISDKIMTLMCDAKDMCAASPCRNGGTCVSLPGDYYCQCQLGYAGEHCERSCNARADVIFLLDSSGSVGEQNFRRVKEFVHDMVNHLTIGRDATRVGVAMFSTRARHGFYLNDHFQKDQVQNAISGLGYEYGNTNTAGGLKLVRTRMFTSSHGDRADTQNFLMVITDGLSNINPDSTITEAGLLKKKGVHIYTVGVGGFDPWEIHGMASEPTANNAFVINDFSALWNISEGLIKATCRDPSICDENPCQNGGVCVPGINTYTCECSHGYMGKFCDMACMTKKDIVFVVDASASVGEANFFTILDFVKALVEELSGEGSDNRFALITYSTDVSLVFSLGRYDGADIILNAISSTRYAPGATNTAGGIRTALEVLSSSGYGNRRDAEDIVILLTDGQSNVNSHDTIPSADDLKATGARVITVGIGLTNTHEIDAIASGPNDVFQAQSFGVLKDVKAGVIQNSCNGHAEEAPRSEG